MYELQGKLTGKPLPIFAQRALEYLSCTTPEQWVHVPYIITLRDPDDERLINQSRKLAKLFRAEAQDYKDDMRFDRRNLLIEMRDRVPEVMTILKISKAIQETVQPLGFKQNRYYFGLQVTPQDMKALLGHPAMRHCEARPVAMSDITALFRMRPVMEAPRLAA